MIFHIGSWTFGEGRNLQVRVGSFPERFVFHAFLTFRDERIPNHVGDEIDMLLEYLLKMKPMLRDPFRSVRKRMQCFRIDINTFTFILISGNIPCQGSV